jgi:hypothetical protein
MLHVAFSTTLTKLRMSVIKSDRIRPVLTQAMTRQALTISHALKRIGVTLSTITRD